MGGLNIGSLNVGGFEHSTGLNVDVRLSMGAFLKMGAGLTGGLNMGAD